MRLSIQRAGITSSGGYGCRRLLPTAVLPNSPRAQGVIDMATVAAGATHHRGMLSPIRGHRNTCPVFPPRDSETAPKDA